MTADVLERDRLLSGLDRGLTREVRRSLADATEEERRAVRPEVVAHAARLRERRREGRDTWRLEVALRVAQVGVRSGPAEVVAPLLGLWPPDLDHAVGVLRDRNPRWLPELVTRLDGAPLRTDEALIRRWRLVEDVRLLAGAPRPFTSTYAGGLALHLLDWSNVLPESDPRDLREAVRADPEVAALVPLMLSAEGLSFAFHHNGVDADRRHVPNPPRCWPCVIADLAGARVVDRTEVIERALDRLSLGENTQHHARGLVNMLEAIQVKPVEARTRVATLTGLLSARQSFVADWALATLRAADAADPLDDDDLASALAQVLARREKGPALRALRWAQRAAVRADDSGRPTDVVASALADGVLHHRADVGEASVRALAGLPGRDGWAHETVRAIRAAVDSLPALRRSEARAVLGWPADADAEVSGGGSVRLDAALPDLADLVVPLPALPLPLQDEAALIEALASPWLESAARDVVLDGAARLLAGRQDRVRAAVARLQGPADDLRAREVTTVLLEKPRRRGFLARVSLRASGAEAELDNRLEFALAAEIRDAAAAGWRGPLLSRPDTPAGLVDPDRLLADLATHAAAGTAPLPLDLERALLRLPAQRWPVLDEDLVSRLPSWADPVRRRVGPLPEPVVTLISPRPPATRYTTWPPEPHLNRWSATWTWPDLGPWDGPVARVAEPRGRLREPWSWRVGRETLPARPEAFAAVLLHEWNRWGDSGEPQVEDVLWLAHHEIAPGPAARLVLALAASATRAEVRAAAVDAFATLLGRGLLAEDAFGQTLADLADRLEDRVKLGRWAATFAEVARLHPAAAAPVWAMLRSLLDGGLSGPLAGRAGLSDLLVTATDAAHASGARGELGAVTELAGRGGASKAVRQAARLRDVLTGATTR